MSTAIPIIVSNKIDAVDFPKCIFSFFSILLFILFIIYYLFLFLLHFQFSLFFFFFDFLEDIWLGGGEVDLKMGINVKELAMMAPHVFFADITQEGEGDGGDLDE